MTGNRYHLQKTASNALLWGNSRQKLYKRFHFVYRESVYFSSSVAYRNFEHPNEYKVLHVIIEICKINDIFVKYISPMHLKNVDITMYHTEHFVIATLNIKPAFNTFRNFSRNRQSLCQTYPLKCRPFVWEWSPDFVILFMSKHPVFRVIFSWQ